MDEMRQAPDDPPSGPAGPASTGTKSGVRKWAPRVIGGVLTVFLVPWLLARIGQVDQDRQKETELRVELAGQIDDSVTATAVKADLFASGLLSASDRTSSPPATGQESATAYADALNTWLVNSSSEGNRIQVYFGPCPLFYRLGSPNGTYNPGLAAQARSFAQHESRRQRLACNWLHLFASITDYLRLSTHLEDAALDRAAAVTRIRYFLATYAPNLATGDTDWQQLQTGTAPSFFTNFQKLRDQLLWARDVYLADLSSAHLKGYLLHFWDFS